MNDRENRTYQKLLRVRAFVTARTADFTNNAFATQTFTSLGSVIEEIESQFADEASARGDARQGTETRAHARAALRDDLEAINRTAKAVAIEVPGVGDKFRVPRNNNDAELLNAARAFLADAAPFSDEFTQHELPATFLQDLQADINALEAAISNQSGGVENSVAAGAALDDAFDRGIDLTRRLDAIVRNKYANNPGVLAEWTSANHTERSPRRARPEPPPPPPPSPPPAQPPA